MAKKIENAGESDTDLPALGDVFVFPLGSEWNVSSFYKPSKRLGACRVVRVDAGKLHRRPAALVVVCAWTGLKPPKLSEPELRTICRMTHRGEPGQPEMAWVFWTAEDPQVVRIGTLPPTPDERRLHTEDFTLEWRSFADQATLQYRWEHDRQKMEAEGAAWHAKFDREFEAERKRSVAKLKGLTLAKLRRRKQMNSRMWKDFVPARVLVAGRKLFATMLDELIALGPDAKEAKKLAAIKRCVVGINKLEAKHEFIGTEEREELCEQFAAVAHCAGVGHHELIDRWRDW